MPTLNDDLLLSFDVYNDTSLIESGWQRIAQSNKSSGMFAAAYQKGSEIVIAYRGFNDFDPNDVPDIIRAYDGKPFEQIRDAQKFYDKILAANPDADISVTGHSLGGALASIIAVRNGVKGETFAGIESVGAAYGSMDGYNYNPLGVSVWKIPAATHNLDITKQELSTYADVHNNVIFGDIATYNDRTTPFVDEIGTDTLFGRIIKNGIRSDDALFGRYENLTGDAFTTFIPAHVKGAPYSDSFSTAIHALGFHALEIVFNSQMDALWPALPRLAYQLTNDYLATEANGDGSYRMTFDALDKMMFDHLSSPGSATTVAEAMIADWQDIASAGSESVSISNADINTALLQLSIQYASAQVLGDTPAENTGGVVSHTGDYLQAGLNGSPSWGNDILPEGARLIRKYADYMLSQSNKLADTIVSNVKYLLAEAHDGAGSIINSDTNSADLVFGGGGSDVLNGKFAGDALFGLSGKDTIYGGGANDVLSGGWGLDILKGNDANDFLNGGKDQDTLSGGAGADTFAFTNLLNGNDGDHIIDFGDGNDVIALSKLAFAGIGDKGVLAAAAFVEGSAAADSHDRIIYDSGSGALFFDADGSGSGVAVRFATLSPGLDLSSDDFRII